MLRLKGGDSLEMELLPRHGDGVADGEHARVEHADDVPSVGLVDDLPLGGQHLLGLAEAQLFPALHVVVLRVPLELAGADPHKGDPVPVGLVHVGLDLEDKGGEVLGEGVDLPDVRNAAEGGRGHAQELLQEGLHAEVGQSGAEEHRAQRPGADGVHIEVPARA